MIDHSLQSSVSESWQMQKKKKETPNFYPITSEFAFAVHSRKITKTDSPCKTSEEILVGCYTGWTLQICSPQIKHKVLKYPLKALETKKRKHLQNCGITVCSIREFLVPDNNPTVPFLVRRC